MRAVAVVPLLVASASGLLQRVHEPTVIPAGWEATEEVVAAETPFKVTIGVKRSNAGYIDELLERVSNPQGEAYLQYPTYEELGEKLRPQAAHTGAVKAWLEQAGVKATKEHPHGDYIQAVATAAQLEAMAHGRFTTYVHAATGMKVHRITGGVSVPVEVAAAIDTFSGFHGFPIDPVRVPRGGKAQVGLAGHVTPEVVRSTYNVSKVPASGKSNIQAIAQFQGQYVDDDDLANFCKRYDSGRECKIAKYVGKNREQPGVESMLDTEYIMSIGDSATTWVYSYPNFDFCSDLTTFGADVTGESEHPRSISISYGSQKIGTCSKSIEDRFSQDIAKMGTLGITVMISSGDDGSGLYTRGGRNTDDRMSPSFPASIPTCVAVGSTYFINQVSGEEEATTQFGSGGGFSYDWQVPSYQKEAVSQYLSSVEIPRANYAKNGRGSPDVSALGESYTVVEGGSTISVGGTSASSPAFAGMVTLLNEACLAESGKTLGFANPLFYQNPSMFTDVTHGTNAVGENRLAGWAAIKGWDAATGLGTPRFGVMLNVVKQACRRAARK